MTPQELAVRQAEVTARALICSGFRSWHSAWEVFLVAFRAHRIQRLAARGVHR